jgi:hypothetical protein
MGLKDQIAFCIVLSFLCVYLIHFSNCDDTRDTGMVINIFVKIIKNKHLGAYTRFISIQNTSK